MLFQVVRAILAFFISSYLGFLTFGNYQKSEEIDISSKTAVFLGILSAANWLLITPPPWKSDARNPVGYLYGIFQIVVNLIFCFYVVFSGDTAYAIIPIALVINNMASNVQHYDDTRIEIVLGVVLVTLATVLLFDTSENSASIADSFRNFYGFKDVKDTSLDQSSFLTGKDTVFVHPAITATLVFVFASAVMFFKTQISYSKRTAISVLLDPEKDGIENLSRFIGELRRI